MAYQTLSKKSIFNKETSTQMFHFGLTKLAYFVIEQHVSSLQHTYVLGLDRKFKVYTIFVERGNLEITHLSI